MVDYEYDAIVVGGGVAGLTASVYLARAGRKTLLIEKNSECGGLVNTFSHNGFSFDAGVRALLDAGIIFPMLDDLGIKMEVVKSPVSVGVENEILNIRDLRSLSEYSDLLKRIYPDSKSDIDEVIVIIRKIMRHMDVLYGIENPVFKDLRKDLGFVFRKILPWFPRFLFTVGKINRMNYPVENYLETVVRDPSLRDIISQHFFRNTPAFFALSYFSLYLDYFYPRNGVGTLAEAIRKKIAGHGGEIRNETLITGINAAAHTVTDDRNNTYRYKNLVWAADLKNLYRITDTGNLSPEVVAGIEETRKQMFANRGGDSVYSLFLEVDEPPESFGRIAHGHFFYTPSRQGLGETHRKELTDLLSRFSEVSREDMMDWLDRFTRLNTYEISIPALKDPVMAPHGKTGVIISLLAEYDLFKRVAEAGWLDQFIKEFDDRIIKVITDSIYPMLREKVTSRFSFSPLNIERRVGSSEGGITGWAFREKMPVINKIQIADRSVFTPIPSVYQAGQWAYSPGGVPMSILTGKLAADRIMRK